MREKKAVKCITTGEIFASADEAAKAYDVDRSNIRKCCNGKLKVAGKDSNGQKLKWAFSNGQNEMGKTKEVKTKEVKTKEVKPNGQNESGNYPFETGKNESDRITELETRIAELEKKNEQLEKKNEYLKAHNYAMGAAIEDVAKQVSRTPWEMLPTNGEIKQYIGISHDLTGEDGK